MKKLLLFVVTANILLFAVSCKELFEEKEMKEYTRSYELKSIGIKDKYKAYGSCFLFIGTITIDNKEYYTGFVKSGNAFVRFNLLTSKCEIIENNLVIPNIRFTMRGYSIRKISYDELDLLNTDFDLEGRIKITLPKGSIVENFKL